MDTPTPPSIDYLREFQQRANEAIANAIDFIIKIDSTIYQIDELMHIIQPLQTGRISIKFVSVKGRIRIHPRVYHRIKDNSFYSARVSFKGLRRRVKRSREFEHNHKLMQTLCDYVTTLMQLRVDMGDRISNMDLGVTNTIKARSKQVDDMLVLITSMHSTIQKRFGGEMEIVDGDEDDLDDE